MVQLHVEEKTVDHKDRPANSDEPYDGRKTRNKSLAIPPRPLDRSFLRSRNLHRSYIPVGSHILKLQKLPSFGPVATRETHLSAAFR